MAFTSHMHHIAGTPVEEPVIPPFNCGGPGVCDDCTFQVRWVSDYDAKRAVIFPSESNDLSFDSQVLRNVSAKLRSHNPKPNRIQMLVREYQLSRSIFALADAIDSVADDIDGL
jgi:hypothetical protein